MLQEAYDSLTFFRTEHSSINFLFYLLNLIIYFQRLFFSSDEVDNCLVDDWAEDIFLLDF